MIVVTTSLDITVPAKLSNVRSVRTAVADAAAEAGAGERVVDDVRICVGEAVTNAIVHAYPRRRETNAAPTVDVTVERSPEELLVVVVDHGRGMTSFRQEGDVGYGLKLIERLTLRYLVSSTPSSGTEVRMVFSLNSAS